MLKKRILHCMALFLLSFTFHQNMYAEAMVQNLDQTRVIATVQQAKIYFEKNGIQKSIDFFNKNAKNIFMGDYNGKFYVSPLHPELLKGNQFNYQDSSGAYPVQEEIDKARSGGGWLKGRWRKNPQNGQYQCRKIYILPIQGTNYYVGSWYHYSSDKEKVCVI